MGTAVTNPDGVAGAVGRHRPDERTDPDVPAPTAALSRAARAVRRRLDGPHALERHHRERTVGRIVVTGASLGVPLPLLLWSSLGADIALPLVAVAAAIGAWYGLVLVLVSRRAAEPWLPWVNVTIETFIGTVLAVVIARVAGPQFATGAAMQLAYPAALMLATARLRPVLVGYAAILVLLQHAAVHVAIIEPALAGVPGAPPPLPLFIERSFWLLAIAIAAAVIAWDLRRELSRGGAEGLRRLALERELGRWLSRDVADAILRGEAAPGTAEKREVTVLFCDLRNFTGMCEREAPEAVVELLNVFYARAHEVVASHGGAVNKFLGDGFLALFGAPDEHPNHAHAAAAVAHDILRIADDLRRRGGIWASFELGVGIDTGEVVVGAVGGLSRSEYTAIGPAVNRAARLQGLAGADGHRVMLSSATVARLGPRANVVRVGVHRLKGFAQPEAVYAFRHA